MQLVRFALGEEDAFRAWLREHSRALVLLRGVGCEYSERFEEVFREVEPANGWVRGIREVEEGGDGPVGEALRVTITPTVIAFISGSEADREEAVLNVGIPRTWHKRWVKKLAKLGADASAG